MHAEVVHHVPGRIRLRIPELHACTALSRWMKGPVLSELGIESFRVNTWCASVVITYDRSRAGVVDRLLAALQFFTIADAITEEPSPLVSIVAVVRRVVQSAGAYLKRTHNLVWASLALAGSLAGGFFALAAAPLICLTALPSLTRAWKVLRFERRLNVDFLDSVSVIISL